SSLSSSPFSSSLPQLHLLLFHCCCLSLSAPHTKTNTELPFRLHGVTPSFFSLTPPSPPSPSPSSFSTPTQPLHLLPPKVINITIYVLLLFPTLHAPPLLVSIVAATGALGLFAELLLGRCLAAFKPPLSYCSYCSKLLHDLEFVEVALPKLFELTVATIQRRVGEGQR
ncbi:hypothetical protein CRG98_036081, partial [Punica granatum]